MERGAGKISELDELSIIDANIDSLELERRVRAFHTNAYPLVIKIGNYKFKLENKVFYK